jgi:sulfur carrier protein
MYIFLEEDLKQYKEYNFIQFFIIRFRRKLMKIKVIIGEKEELIDISENKTVKDLLDKIDIASETVVVKKNDSIVIDEELVGDGDLIEVIQVIYGG